MRMKCMKMTHHAIWFNVISNLFSCDYASKNRLRPHRVILLKLFIDIEPSSSRINIITWQIPYLSLVSEQHNCSTRVASWQFLNPSSSRNWMLLLEWRNKPENQKTFSIILLNTNYCSINHYFFDFLYTTSSFFFFLVFLFLFILL